MSEILAVFATITLLQASVAFGRPVDDWLIIPNVRVGPMTAWSTEQSLREAFGEKSVKTFRVDDEIVTNRLTTLVFQNDLTRAIGVSWAGNGKQKHPETVSFCFGLYGVAGAWRTKSGIGCGTTLSQLEDLNGRPFVLTGYYRDSSGSSGTVISWQGGRLEQELGPKGAFEISLAPDDKHWWEKLTGAERAFLKKDRILSDDPMIQGLMPVVYSMVFRFIDSEKK
jgi:hypothetical protein